MSQGGERPARPLHGLRDQESLLFIHEGHSLGALTATCHGRDPKRASLLVKKQEGRDGRGKGGRWGILQHVLLGCLALITQALSASFPQVASS